MNNEKIVKEFKKYEDLGAYHWEQISSNIFKRNAFVVARYQLCLNLIEKHMEDNKSSKILDLGCGDGVLSYLIAKKNKTSEVYGIDASELAIQYAINETGKKKCINVNFSKGSVYKLPYPDDFFDIIISTEVIEHLEDVSLFFSEIKRVSKKKGIAIISTPIKTKLAIGSMHYQEWFIEEYEELFNSTFSNSQFYLSHRIMMLELYRINKFSLLFWNFFSLFKNPFNHFFSKEYFNLIQYGVGWIEK